MMAPSKSKSGRGKSWTTPELNRMLTAVEAVLPLGSNEWESVAARYDTELPREFNERDVDAIKRKFMLLKNSMKPTGDPACPEEVVRAKRAYYLMESRAGVEPFDDTTSATVASAEVDDTGVAAESPEKHTTPSEGVTAPPAPILSVAQAAPETATETRSASKRCGKSPEQLAQLSNELKRRASTVGATGSMTVSQTVKRRRTIDILIGTLEHDHDDGSDAMQMVIDMDERAAARDFEYRREREEREAKREEREQRRDELFFALMAKLVGEKTMPSSR
ncbi:hypothetical protein PF005_g5021 [Phytophthora fragariae]|uniref:DUF6818 domain-containing protein n=2 Tax=Phytophthora fragariae TaxID=53985 RepID=A0A6A3YZJ0_9STRA|nr:hypothetical protein PF011_g4403 [Phytophthora fragariae]KAE9129645.1 hypothetical protein PF010_g4112 [Phytophthora fragariae]KAE9151881.1 hypothetical protein PF006_g3872 [Phytophthora fragariae]KAE9226728.1 hypothetical protein PF005_g5021 [Phytophthora fragariae]KAE9247388.1 hypothetical protein PF004_g4352 [Phytophthora fragariae]